MRVNQRFNGEAKVAARKRIDRLRLPEIRKRFLPVAEAPRDECERLKNVDVVRPSRMQRLELAFGAFVVALDVMLVVRVRDLHFGEVRCERHCPIQRLARAFAHDPIAVTEGDIRPHAREQRPRQCELGI